MPMNGAEGRSCQCLARLVRACAVIVFLGIIMQLWVNGRTYKIGYTSFYCVSYFLLPLYEFNTFWLNLRKDYLQECWSQSARVEYLLWTSSWPQSLSISMWVSLRIPFVYLSSVTILIRRQVCICPIIFVFPNHASSFCFPYHLSSGMINFCD